MGIRDVRRGNFSYIQDAIYNYIQWETYTKPNDQKNFMHCRPKVLSLRISSIQLIVMAELNRQKVVLVEKKKTARC